MIAYVEWLIKHKTLKLKKRVGINPFYKARKQEHKTMLINTLPTITELRLITFSILCFSCSASDSFSSICVTFPFSSLFSSLT